MAPHAVVRDVFGPGTFVDVAQSPVPSECYRLLKYVADRTPGLVQDATALDTVEFRGADLPIIPGPLKSQVFAAVLHGIIGLLGKDICSLRGIETGKISIDTDKAGLYPATAALVSIGGGSVAEAQKYAFQVGKQVERGIVSGNNLRYRTWSIYPTKDPKVWYQILGSLDPPGMLKVYDIDSEAPCSSRDDAYEIIKAEMTKYSAAELEQKNMEHGLCGQTCYTPAQWRQTSMSKSLARRPLIDVRRKALTADLPPVPFPTSDDPRPLAGIKVVELARVIAAPAMGASLAALGADVIKVFSPNLHDLQPLTLTLTAGKQTCALDLKVEADRRKLLSLIEEADVVIQAFRQGSIERKGFGLETILDLATRRKKGIVYVNLNCYGPDGYYAERPGFQQIADAASGCSYVCGKAYGYPEGTAVLPPLPIADMLAGAVGVIDVLFALRSRALHGGSYNASVALTAVDTIQLEEEVGLYSPETVQKIQDTYQFGRMGPEHHVEELLYVLADAWAKHSDILKRPQYWVNFPETAFGENHSILSPIVKFENDAASPRWKHGPVANLLHRDTVFR